MSITIYIDIFCDCCPNRIAGYTSNKPNRKLARCEAKRVGWERKRINGELKDICPDCRKVMTYKKGHKE